MFTDTQLHAKIEKIKKEYINGAGLPDDDVRFLLAVANSHPVAQLVRFHKKYKHTINELPDQEICIEDKDLRMKLIIEEIAEYYDAHDNDNTVEMYDALLDIIYVAYGTLLTYGLPAYEGQNEVHFSNMSKSNLKDDNGKTVKGKDYFKPRLKAIINAVEFDAKQDDIIVVDTYDANDNSN